MRSLILGVLLVALVVKASPALGQVPGEHLLFDRPWPGTDGTGCADSDPGAGQIIADNFTLTHDATIQRVEWWGAYNLNWGLPPGQDLEFEIRFYLDNEGLPRDEFFHETRIRVPFEDLGPCCGGFEAFRLTVSLMNEVFVPANTRFWMSIRERDTTFSNVFCWSRDGTDGDGLAAKTSNYPFWRSDIGDLCFRLYGEVPGQYHSAFTTIAVIGDFPGIDWFEANQVPMTQVTPGVWKATVPGIPAGNHYMKFRTNNNWGTPDPDYGSASDESCRPSLNGPTALSAAALCIVFPMGTAAYEFTLDEINLTYAIVRQGQAGQSINGTVVFGGIAQAPYPAARVRLQAQNSSTDLGYTSTDPTTRAFSFAGLDPGSYKLIVSANCFRTVTVENLVVTNAAVNVGAVNLGLAGSSFQRMQVAGSFNGFDLGVAPDMAALPNCVWADTVTVLDAANPVEFKFITNGDFDTTPDYGVSGIQIDPAAGPCVLGAPGDGGNIRVTLAQPGQYRFELDEIYFRYSVTWVDPMPTGNVQHWWPGNGTAVDVVSGLNGQIGGDAAYGQGVEGLSFQFDGDGDYVEIPFDQSINFGPAEQFTVAAWVVPRRVSSYQALVVKSPVTGVWDWGLYLDPTNKFYCGFHGLGGALSVTEAQPNTWYFAAFSYNAGEWRLYVDGQLEGSSSGGYVLQSAGALHFGTKGDWQAGAFDFFKGRLDQVQIFDRALSDQEIQCLFACPLASADPTPHDLAKVMMVSPNPFSEIGRFRVLLPSPGLLTLEVFDIAGRKVWSSAKEGLVAGFHEFVWNGTGSTGDHLANGVYLYRASQGTANIIGTGRVVLTR